MRVGVLLPLSGPDDTGADDALTWAADGLNAAGGVGGRRVELVFRDTNGQDVERLARGLIDDQSVRVVIGPATSAEVYEIAPLFIKAKKLLISPSSTAGDIFRAFGKKRFFWRTCQSDVAQVRTILYVLASRGVKRLSLVYEDGPYGKTFSEWMGFFAIERGMELLDVVKVRNGQGNRQGQGQARDQTQTQSRNQTQSRTQAEAHLVQAVTRALEGDPQYVVCAVPPEDAVRIKRELDRRHVRAKPLFTDAAESQYVLDRLGAAAEGLEVVSPAADPKGGFEREYEKRFGYAPWDYAAPTYDAFVLAACALARVEERGGGQSIGDALADVVAGRGRRVAWDRTSDAVAAIRAGELPDLVGASGPLDFDREFGIDPLRTFYAVDRVSTKRGARDFRTTATIDSDETLGYGVLGGGASAGRTTASPAHFQVETRAAPTYVPGPRKDLWAVIAATSAGWEDYRHQADALAVYDLLKGNGVGDDRIVLFSVDDVSRDRRARPRGDVHDVVGGKDLRKGAVIDYAGDQVTVRTLEDVLLGDKSAGAPTVLESDRGSDVLLYLVDHGEPGSILFEKDARAGAMSAEALARVVELMHERRMYRQMLIVGEVCYGESLVSGIRSPGVVCLTGAARGERSFATNYDDSIRNWLADDFTFQTLDVISQAPDISIADLYATVYERVAGSHVRLTNQRAFGNVYTARICEFVAP